MAPIRLASSGRACTCGKLFRALVSRASSDDWKYRPAEFTNDSCHFLGASL